MEEMSTTLPPSIPPRVLDHDDAPAARTSWRPPAQTLRGALAGAEAAIGSWLVIAVLAIAGYVATAAAPELGSAGWVDAARVGSAVWLLGHGGVVELTGAAITVVPLGVSLICVAGVATSLRRVRPQTWWPVVAALLAYTALAAGFAALASTSGSWRGVLGAPVLAAVGALAAVRGRPPKELTRLLERIPAAVRAGAGAGARAAVALLALGLLIVIVALIVNFSRVTELHRALVPDTVSSVIMVAAQLILLPTLALWAVGFLTGPGFAVGQGTSFAPTGIDAGPLPVVPVLGALPEPDGLAGSMGLVVLLGMLVGAAAGLWLRRRQPASLAQTAIAVAVAALVAAVIIGALSVLSAGSVGPGRMAQVGSDAWAVGVAVIWQIGLGAAVTALLVHPETRALAGRGWEAARQWWASVREG